MLAEKGTIDMTASTSGEARHGRGLAQTTLHLIDEIYRFALLPLAEFWWHSCDDLLRLRRASSRAIAPGRLLFAPLLALDRRLPPFGRQGRFPVKLAVYTLAMVIAWQFLTASATIEDLQASGELRVVSRESPTPFPEGKMTV